MSRTHRYEVRIAWEGATTGYRDYARDHSIEADGRPAIEGSSDPAFRGNPARWNPEQLFVASLAACHKLWFLHLAAAAGLVVTRYEDVAEGVMIEEAGGGGRFERVVLRPCVATAGGDSAVIAALHHEAHARCYIANSVNFPVDVAPQNMEMA